MRKLIVLLVFLTASAHAKWGLLNRDDLIKSADSIVIAEFIEYKKTNLNKNYYNQIGYFKRISTLKGVIEEKIEVWGATSGICRPEVSFEKFKPGKYLMFLSKTEDGWIDCNTFIRPILSNQVDWFTDSHSQNKVSSELRFAVRDIKGYFPTYFEPNFFRLPKEEAHQKAKQLAEEDFKNGVYGILCYGRSASIQNKDYLWTNYQIISVPIAGCCVDDTIIATARGYNETMKKLLLQKFGKDIFEEAKKEVD